MAESDRTEEPGVGPGFQPEWKSELPDIRMQLGQDDEAERQKRAGEQEFRARSEYLGREEQFSRRDPELQLILFPENPKDINKATTRILEKYTSLDLREASSPYRIQYYMEAADACQFIYGHSNEDLTGEGYVEGQIGEDGYLSQEGRPKKFGYAIRVDTERREITVKEQKERRHGASTEKTRQTHYIPKFNSEGGVESLQPVQVEVEIEHPARIEQWEEVSTPTITIEKFYYGKDNERKALQNAAKASFERQVNTVRQHDLFLILENSRADISGLVTMLFLRANRISNAQWKQIFNSPDIGKITPEKLENNEYGSRIDKAMRMMDLLGHAETREKMEDFMNRPTFEKIVEAVKARALEVMQQIGYVDEDAKTDEEKVARFLVGKGAIKIGAIKKEDERWVLEGKAKQKDEEGNVELDESGQPIFQYWKTFEERDPANATPEEIKLWKDKDEKWAMGFAAIKEEKEVRGFLTEHGNVYARAKKIDLLHARITLLLGDRSAVRDADRYFELTGMRDESNLEVLSKKMPTTEEIITAHRVKGNYGYDMWREKADWWLEYFNLPGDPTASDLSKIFYPDYYRLKDILRDRPAGPLLTVFDFDRFTQSMFSLGRSEVKIEGVKKRQIRSLLEQWRGYAKDANGPREEAKDLGEIGWDAVQVPEEIKKAVQELREKSKDEEVKKAVGKLMDEAKGTVEGKLWQYYTLLNWLAGRDNKLKAPWLFILDENENLPVLNRTETFTNKEKFISILWHGPAVAWGEWRKLYAEHGKTEKENLGEKVKKALDDLAIKKTQKGKKDWYKGVRNLYQFPEFMAQKVNVVRATSAGYSSFEVPMLERVEGIPDEPGLAVRLGFMSIEEVAENKTKRFLEEQKLR